MPIIEPPATAPIPLPTVKADQTAGSHGLGMIRIGLLYVLMGASVATVLARVPAMRDEFQLGTDGVGLLLFGYGLGAMVGLLSTPALLGRIGLRKSIMLGMAISVGGLLLLCFSASVWNAFVPGFIGLILANTGMGIIDVSMNVAGAELERIKQRSLLPILHAGFSLGAALGALVATGLIAMQVPMFPHLLGFVILLAIVGGGAVYGLRSSSDASGNNGGEEGLQKGSIRAALSWKVIFVAIAMLGFSFAEGSAGDWMQLGALDGHGLDETTAVAFYTVFMWTMFIGRVAGGPVVDRFGRAFALQVSAVVAFVGILMYIFTNEPWTLFVASALWGLGIALGFPVTMSVAGDDPKHAAARVSIISIAGYGATLSGPPLLGLLGKEVGVLPSLIVPAVLVGIAFFASIAAKEQAAPQGEAASAAR